MNLFEVKVGISDIVTFETKKQVYLVDAMSFTEAEAKATKAAEPYSSKGIEVLTVKKSRVEELINENDATADKWYIGKVAFTTLDNDKEKRSCSSCFIKADSFSQAHKLLAKAIYSYMADHDIASLSETQIFDFIK